MVTSVKLGDVDTVQSLLTKNLVSVNTLHRGASLLCLAVCRNQVDMVTCLVSAGADVNTCYTWQSTTETPLIAAVRLGYGSVVWVLVNSPNIDLNIKDSHGKTGFFSSYILYNVHTSCFFSSSVCSGDSATIPGLSPAVLWSQDPASVSPLLSQDVRIHHWSGDCLPPDPARS